MMHYVLEVYEYERTFIVDCVIGVFKAINATVNENWLVKCVQYGYVVFDICLKEVLILEEE